MSMSGKDKRTGWLARLQIGDMVVIDRGNRMNGSAYAFGYVEKITPTGRITLKENKGQFDHTGYMIGEGGYARTSLSEATETRVNSIRRMWWKDKVDTILYTCGTNREVREMIIDEDLIILRKILEPYYTKYRKLEEERAAEKLKATEAREKGNA